MHVSEAETEPASARASASPSAPETPWEKAWAAAKALALALASATPWARAYSWALNSVEKWARDSARKKCLVTASAKEMEQPRARTQRSRTCEVDPSFGRPRRRVAAPPRPRRGYFGVDAKRRFREIRRGRVQVVHAHAARPTVSNREQRRVRGSGDRRSIDVDERFPLLPAEHVVTRVVPTLRARQHHVAVFSNRYRPAQSIAGGANQIVAKLHPVGRREAVNRHAARIGGARARANRDDLSIAAK